jgi:hypothetical protein
MLNLERFSPDLQTAIAAALAQPAPNPRYRVEGFHNLSGWFQLGFADSLEAVESSTQGISREYIRVVEIVGGRVLDL